MERYVISNCIFLTALNFNLNMVIITIGNTALKKPQIVKSHFTYVEGKWRLVL